MPELPEVETIRCGLEDEIVGKKIEQVDSDTPKQLNHTLAFYRQVLLGLKIRAVKRRAKMLYLVLSDDLILAFHLKMSGQLIYQRGKKQVVGGHPIKDGEVGLPNKHTHFIITFSGGDRLFFNDTRKFGWVRLYKKDEFEEQLALWSYGPEPLTLDFSQEYFNHLLDRYPKRKIKHLLLDQQGIAGIGNIYADEDCYFAKVKPNRKVGTLTEGEKTLLYKGIKKILPKAIECGGSSIASHLDARGRKGSYSQYHMVYGRYGEPCFKCGAILKKMVVAGRTSTYCPAEQR